MISPPMRRATSIAIPVLPVAVAPVMTRQSAMAAEAPNQFVQRETYNGRAAMHVVIRQLGGKETFEQLRHLARREFLAGFNGAFTRERHSNALVLILGCTRQLAAGRQ